MARLPWRPVHRVKESKRRGAAAATQIEFIGINRAAAHVAGDERSSYSNSIATGSRAKASIAVSRDAASAR
jgi:hypothetical protein